MCVRCEHCIADERMLLPKTQCYSVTKHTVTRLKCYPSTVTMLPSTVNLSPNTVTQHLNLCVCKERLSAWGFWLRKFTIIATLIEE